jgi:hypothetical protein
MNDEDHREDEMGENAGNEGPQKHPPGSLCVFMVLLSEKEVFLRSGRVLCQLSLKEHQLVGVANGIQVLDMLVGDIEHRYELQA